MSKRLATDLPRRGPLSIAYLPIDCLKPDPGNARQHGAKQIRQIARSIEAFGFNVPVLIDANDNVIAGHGLLLACKRLGWTKVPTIRLEHLSETQKRAFTIADRRGRPGQSRLPLKRGRNAPRFAQAAGLFSTAAG